MSTAIFNLYSKCGALKQASIVFDKMKNRNVITWTAIVVGLAQNEHAEAALKLFTQCKKREFQPILLLFMFNPFLCPHLIRRGYAFDAVNMTALINMYAKCKTINSAEMVFGTGSSLVMLFCGTQ